MDFFFFTHIHTLTHAHSYTHTHTGWFTDAVSHLGLKESVGVNEYSADYGQLPDFGQYNPKHDALFTYNGTTSGARYVCVCVYV